MRGIILYGPPASGKDTITRALIEAVPQCELFHRLKVGPGKTATYRMTTAEHLTDLRSRGAVAWENSRYGSIYVVDTPELIARLRRRTPVLHLGQAAAVEAVRRATPEASWVVISLWCARGIAQERLMERNPADVRDRLRAWDATEALPCADISIDTGVVSPSAAVRTILHILDSTTATKGTVNLPRVVVPVLTLRNPDGTLDMAANAAYAERAAATWLHGFIVSATLGEGDTTPRPEREKLLGLWLDRVAPQRVFCTAWGEDDYQSLASSGARVMAVMRGLSTTGEVLRFLAALPPQSYVYSHPNYTPVTYSAEISSRAVTEGIAPSGGKLCKISLADIRAIRSQTGPWFDLLDGRCRHVARSMDAGASGVIATPLSTLPDLPPEGDIAVLQALVDKGQALMDTDQNRDTRTDRLTSACKEALAQA